MAASETSASRQAGGAMSDPAIRLLFTPEQLKSYGRCDKCGWHPPTQGHHQDCPTNTSQEKNA